MHGTGPIRPAMFTFPAPFLPLLHVLFPAEDANTQGDPAMLTAFSELRGRVRIRTLVNALAALAVVGMVVVFGLLLRTFEQQEQRTRRGADEFAALQVLRDIEEAIGAAERATLAFATTPSPAALARAQLVFDDALEALGELSRRNVDLADPRLVARSIATVAEARDLFTRRARTLLSESASPGAIGAERRAMRDLAMLDALLAPHRTGMLRSYFTDAVREVARAMGRRDRDGAREWAMQAAMLRHQIRTDTDLRPDDRIAALALFDRAARRISAMLTMREEFLSTIDRVHAELAAASAGLQTERGTFADNIRRMLAADLREQDRTELLLALSVVILALILFGAGRWIGEGLTRPLTQLSDRLQRMARGELDMPVPRLGARNEIGAMAHAAEMLRRHALDRRIARQKLREANRRTRDVIHAMREALIETDTQCRITLVNPAAEELLGRPVSQLIGRPVLEFLGALDGSRFDCLDDLQERMATRIFCLRPGGTRVPVAASVADLRNSDGSRRGRILVMRDITHHIENEHQLGQFKSVLDMVDADVIMFEPETLRITYMNERTRRMAGLPDDWPADLTLQDLGYRVPDIERLRRRLEKAAQQPGRQLIYENTLLDADGNETREQVHLQLMAPEGLPPRFVAFAFDITDEYRNRIDLRRFKDTLDSTEDAVFMFHAGSLKFIYLNEKARKLTGWRADEITQKRPEDMNPAFDEKRFRLLTKPLVFGTQRTISLITRGLDRKPVELTVELFHPDDADPWFVVTTRDISSRIKAENELRVFRQTLDLSQDEIFMVDPDTLTYLYQNNAARRFSGWLPAEYRKKHIRDLNPDFDEEAFRERIRPLLEGREKRLVYETTGRNGREIEASIEYVKPEGAKPRLVIITRDISQRKAAEKAKREFVSTVSHELRTPLTSIKGALGIIDAGAAGELTAQQKSLISIALNNSTRLNRLIDDILDMEKIEAGKMEFDMQPVDLASLIDEAVEANAGYATKHEVSFRARGTDRPAVVTGDPGRLMQVLANLMSNAAKFSKPGDEIEIVLEQKDGKARVSVIDHGCGIPEKAQATIFDKFTQADSSDRRSKGGTGLGLNIVKLIVEAHGGRIDFVSKEGEGTTFFFDLDLAEAGAGDGAGDGAAARGRLLVCEDDRALAEGLQRTLAEAGFEAEIAKTVTAAKRALAEGDFDAVLLGVGAARGRTSSVIRGLRRAAGDAELPVLVTAAEPSGDGGVRIRGGGLNLVEWLGLPLDEQRLAEALETPLESCADAADGAAGAAPARRPRVLHVEDDADVVAVVRHLLEDRAELACATTLAVARRLLKRETFDLVILDLGLPDGRGEAILAEISAGLGGYPPVIVFSAEEADPHLAARVEGALVKARASNADLLELIDATLRRAGADEPLRRAG